MALPYTQWTFPDLTFTPPSDGQWTIAWLYANPDGSAISSPGYVHYLGTSTTATSGLGYSDSQVMPLFAVTAMGGIITAVTDLQKAGGIATDNVQDNAITPTQISVFDSNEDLFYQYLPPVIKSAISSGGLITAPLLSGSIPVSCLPASGYGSTTLAGLTDVSITSPASGQGLIYNGSKWTNQAIPETTSLPLSGLTQSGATTGQVPTWNGSTWTAATPASGGGGGINVVSSLPTASALNYAQLYLVSVSGSATSLAQIQVSDGASHQYILNESSGGIALDSVGGSGYNGTYSSVTLAQPPVATGATYSTYFNGSSSYMQTPIANPNGTSGSNPWTLEFAFIASSTNSSARVMANDHSDSDNKGVMVRISQTSVEVNIGNDGPTASLSLGATPHLFTLTYNGSGGFIGYIDGSSVVTGTQTYVAGTNNLALGFDPAYSGDWFNGFINCFAIYPTCLTSTQVINHNTALRAVVSDELYVNRKIAGSYVWTALTS